MKTFLQYLAERNVNIELDDPTPPYITHISHKFQFKHLHVSVTPVDDYGGNKESHGGDFGVHATVDALPIKVKNANKAVDAFVAEVNKLSTAQHIELASWNSSDPPYNLVIHRAWFCNYGDQNCYENALQDFAKLDNAIDKILISRKCPDCKGTGKYQGFNSRPEDCKTCGGSGFIF